MSIFRKKGYNFADDILATDTIISFVFGILSIICIIIAVIWGIATKGNAGAIIGVLPAASLIMSITGLLFGYFGTKQVEGGVNSKRVAILVSAIGLILTLFIFFVGKLT